MPTELPRVIFLPGHLCSSRLFEAQLLGLSDVAVCKVGHLNGADSMASMAKHVLDHAPEKFSLAGLSMGGYVSLEIMRQAPHRVERLALLDTMAAPDRPEQWERRSSDIALAADHGMTALTAILYERWLTAAHAQELSLRAAIDEMAQEIGVINQRLQQKAIYARPDSRRTLQGIACPTLVLCGRHDRVTPLSAHEEMAALIPNARLRVIEDCAHLSTIEQPEAVTKALRDWLTWY
jgi:pimeloyl-ACP methyl ester carboxylesterase